MPDDDYEKTVVCGCTSCAKINNEMEKTKQINALLDFAEISLQWDTISDVKTALSKIIEAMRLMNTE